MATAYQFTGPGEMDYHHLGRVTPGDIAYFEHRAPDDRWTPVTGTPSPPASTVDTGKVERHEAAVDEEEARFAEQELKRPNKAAPAAEWKAYAAAEGSFEAKTGQNPDEATRAALIDFYTASDAENDGEQAAESKGE